VDVDLTNTSPACCAVLRALSAVLCLLHVGKENRGNTAVKEQQQQPAASNPPPQQQQQQYQQQPGYVPCPICNMSVRESFINSHVDSCLEKAGGVAAVPPPPATTNSSRPPRHHHHSHHHQQQQQQTRHAQPTSAAGAGGSSVSGSGGGGGWGTAQQQQQQQQRRVRRGGKPLEAPPKLCFELLKERELKGKLTGLGLSNDGNKKVGRGGLEAGGAVCVLSGVGGAA